MLRQRSPLCAHRRENDGAAIHPSRAQLPSWAFWFLVVRALMTGSALKSGVRVPLPSLLRATEPNLILWVAEKVSLAVNYFHTIFSEGSVTPRTPSFPGPGFFVPGYSGFCNVSISA